MDACSSENRGVLLAKGIAKLPLARLQPQHCPFHCPAADGGKSKRLSVDHILQRPEQYIGSIKEGKKRKNVVYLLLERFFTSCAEDVGSSFVGRRSRQDRLKIDIVRTGPL